MIAWRDYKGANPDAKVDDFLKPSFRKRESLVEIIAYCLNPNHYHFILRQIKDKGVEKFMHKIGVSHTKYFNKKNKRSGSLFQGKFKAVHVDSNEYLLYLSAYINKNNFIHGYNKIDSWPYSSLRAYLGKENNNIIRMEPVMGQFRDADDYANYMDENALYMKEKKELEKYLIED
jgi:putative transposase